MQVPMLQLLLENFNSKKGLKYVRKLEGYCPTGLGSPFDSKQLI